ncbi:N-acetylmuramoyl-L-alanine amidase [Streptomyces sp. Ru72]|uniref:N-acetylmuramoyl-L-alanine amidase n=1 Tax=Streptomyces sp. Ru72 TaxID=2080747 RepID=UPI000CDD055C|nr:N-acetylmuramoyl-L-alanine amidase [Streptomyces sp. Ru72]POX54421.1 N-acetylmuramoyl-L-alanine amidase [Streptomyces sp. Ru72]
MRGYLASSIGATCAAVLTLPLAIPAAVAGTGVRHPSASAAVPGSTQSFPLVPFTRTAGAVVEAGLTPQAVRSFSLVGVVWDDPGTELHGHVEVRTRASGTHQWSEWQELETHHHGHGPDPGTAEGRSSRARGATAPLWVGDSDGVAVRVSAEGDDTGTTRSPVLPNGLRVELVDPGVDSKPGAPGPTAHAAAPEPSDRSAPGTAAAAGSNALGRDAGRMSPGDGAAPSPSHEALEPQGAKDSGGPQGTVKEPPDTAEETAAPAQGTANPADTTGPAKETPGKEPEAVPQQLPEHSGTHTAPRPKIVTRSGWGADETLREAGFVYTDSVKVAFVHHTASGNNYTCAEAPSVIRSIYRYHVVSNGWRDIGYNFLVDKCGTIYEGRAGGIDKPVLGAHTLGFNSDSTGIAVIGTYSGNTKPSAQTLDGVGALSAWKLGLYGMDPRATTYLVSGGGNLYPKGVKAQLNVLSGHRDGYATDCPGAQLYGKLSTIRSTAARLQGR